MAILNQFDERYFALFRGSRLGLLTDIYKTTSSCTLQITETSLFLICLRWANVVTPTHVIGHTQTIAAVTGHDPKDHDGVQDAEGTGVGTQGRGSKSTYTYTFTRTHIQPDR